MLRMAFVLLAIAAGATLLHFLSGCAKPVDSFHAQDITGADFGQLAQLDGFTDHRGSRLASADFRGKAVVVFFGYTQCPDICPTTLSAMKETMHLLGSEGDRLQVLFVTVDPERDTQTILAEYVPWFDPRFIGLRADPDTTRTAAQAFKVFYAKVAGSAALGYSIDHTAESYAYDPQGRLRLKIAHGANARQIAEDLSKLLAGK
ncbi:MAG: SCO family protein [Pseudomonadota bacterium]